VRGTYQLTVTWDQARASGTNFVELAGLTVEGVERETGTLAVVAKITAASRRSHGHRPAQARHARMAGVGRSAGGKRGARVSLPASWLSARVEAKRFAEAEVLQTIAENFNLTTVVAEDARR